ncbi:PRC-barrel domain-containing protein [Streptomyces sp. NPDC058655]|uniref:PRC-barrel domain-containing protein n=1 Tax=Streptomyces sp. NPDC058655 TaxID=3346577 RepID=UPI00364A0ABD
MTDNVWAYRQTSGYLRGTDLTGFKVEATEGVIGKVDKHSEEVGSSYLVVDTGVWIFGKEILLPAGAVTKVDVEDRKIYVDRTKAEIKDAPEFHRNRHLDDAEYRERLGLHYGAGGASGGGPSA